MFKEKQRNSDFIVEMFTAPVIPQTARELLPLKSLIVSIHNLYTKLVGLVPGFKLFIQDFNETSMEILNGGKHFWKQSRSKSGWSLLSFILPPNIPTYQMPLDFPQFHKYFDYQPYCLKTIQCRLTTSLKIVKRWFIPLLCHNCGFLL